MTQRTISLPLAGSLLTMLPRPLSANFRVGGYDCRRVSGSGVDQEGTYTCSQAGKSFTFKKGKDPVQ